MVEKGVVRRVVTAQSSNGKGVISSDGPVPTVFRLGDPEVALVEIWKTTLTPSILRCADEEPATGPLLLPPPKGGHLFRISDIPPDPEGPVSAEAAEALFAQMGAADASSHGAEHEDSGGMMHRTESLDYGIVLDGEIVLVVDEGEVLLKQGDVVVQRGANHAWSNRSGRNCRMAFFMVDARYASE